MVEALRAELVRVKEQARMSNVAAKKATDELKAEQAARRQCKERMSTKFSDPNYALLNQMWISLDAFLDLSKSASNAAQFYQAQEGYKMEKLF